MLEAGREGRAAIGLALAVGGAACVIDLPEAPAVETSSGGDDEGMPMAMVVNDGMGDGRMVPVELHNGPDDPTFIRHALVIGAADEAWEGVARTGQLSVLLDSGSDTGTPGGVLAIPTGTPSTIVEDAHSTMCDGGQRFAWELLPDRRLGVALGYFVHETYPGAGDLRGTILAGAPGAEVDSGALITYLDCQSCALLPKPNGEAMVEGGAFGTAVDVAQLVPGVETLVVGAPTHNSGRVAVLHDFDHLDFFGHWKPSNLWGVRECQCVLGSDECAPWDETLQGSFGAGEEFGAALAVADFDCDGRDDLAVGAPGADLPTMGEPLIDAGAVYVYFSQGGELGTMAPTVLRQGTLEVGGEPMAGERFGSVLAVGNFNGARRVDNDKSCFDLVVGTPNENEGAGQIQVFEGSPAGLVYGGPVIDLDDVFEASADPGDQFGWALVAGDLDVDHYDDLVVGAPGDGLGGSITIIPGDEPGLDLGKATWFRQGDGVASDDIEGDQLGYALTWSHIGLGSGNHFYILVVGAPGEDAGTGAVYAFRISKLDGMFRLGGDTMITQGMIEGDEIVGDRFGTTLLRSRAMTEAPDW